MVTEQEQKALWNGGAGRAWVDAQEVLDRALQPIEDRLVEAIAAGSGGRTLDVGCGTGGTTVAIARRLGPEGRVVGIDISAPMVEGARARAARDGASVTFILDDAQTHAFEPASFDRIVSRFGVMFFDDPARAFANLRRAASRDAELLLMVWRSCDENPFMTTAERAAAPLLPGIPARKPNAAGQFGFADERLVRRVLEASGWSRIDIRAVDVPCAFDERDLVHYITRLGPLGRALADADAETRRKVVEAVRPAFDPYVRGAEVRFEAACWMVGAIAEEVTA